MPLDPISALGVAGNVIQLVDCTAKLVFTDTELHHNQTPVGHGELEAAAIQLRDLRLSMEDSFETIDQPTEEDELGPSITPLSSLREAYSSCVECANAVTEAIEKLTVSGEKPKWKSFRHALLTVSGKDALDATSQRLVNARQQLTFFLLLPAQ